jgi:hypothetical protein
LLAALSEKFGEVFRQGAFATAADTDHDNAQKQGRCEIEKSRAGERGIE